MLINKKHVKRFALECASYRAKKFSRVSAQFTERCEFVLREYIRKEVMNLPSKGVTIQ